MIGIFDPPAAHVSFLDPWSASYVFAQVQTVDCLTLDQLSLYGYIKDDPEAKLNATAMLPQAAKFCIVEGFMAGAGPISDAGNELALRQEFGYDNPGNMPASLLFGPFPVNKNSQDEPRMFPQGFDVTDHIFTGARPGGNAEDTMKPFNQLGEAFQFSPADLFDIKAASYDTLYTPTK